MFIYAAANGVLIAVLVRHNLMDWSFPDWALFERLPELYAGGKLYEPQPDLATFAYSPVAAQLLILILPIGLFPWLVAHLAALWPMRRWRGVVPLVLISAPFWGDVVAGNFFVFVALSGALALTGSRTAGLGYVAFCCLTPRPVQMPLLAWLMWREPTWRLRALAIVVLLTTATIATGYAPGWFGSIVAVGGDNLNFAFNWGPTHVFGYSWLLVGVPLAAVLTWRGYPGLGGLAASPYVLPQYLLVLLWELHRGGASRAIYPIGLKTVTMPAA